MTWEPIDIHAGLWRAEKRSKQGWNIRATAVRMADGRLLVVSPIRGLGDEAHEEVAPGVEEATRYESPGHPRPADDGREGHLQGDDEEAVQ